MLMCFCNFLRYCNLSLLSLPQFDIIIDARTSLRLRLLLGIKFIVKFVDSSIFSIAIVLPYGTGTSDSCLNFFLNQ